MKPQFPFLNIASLLLMGSVLLNCSGPKELVENQHCTEAMIDEQKNLFERQYYSQSMVDKLLPCKEVSDGKLQEEAFRLLALVSYYRDDLETYNAYVDDLIEVDRNYKVPEGDPPFFDEDVNRKSSRARRRRRGRYYVAGGAVLGVAALIVIVSNPSSDPLPRPPGDPTIASGN